MCIVPTATTGTGNMLLFIIIMFICKIELKTASTHCDHELHIRIFGAHVRSEGEAGKIEWILQICRIHIDLFTCWLKLEMNSMRFANNSILTAMCGLLIRIKNNFLWKLADASFTHWTAYEYSDDSDTNFNASRRCEIPYDGTRYEQISDESSEGSRPQCLRLVWADFYQSLVTLAGSEKPVETN